MLFRGTRRAQNWKDDRGESHVSQGTRSTTNSFGGPELFDLLDPPAGQHRPRAASRCWATAGPLTRSVVSARERCLCVPPYLGWREPTGRCSLRDEGPRLLRALPLREHPGGSWAVRHCSVSGRGGTASLRSGRPEGLTPLIPTQVFLKTCWRVLLNTQTFADRTRLLIYAVYYP